MPPLRLRSSDVASPESPKSNAKPARALAETLPRRAPSRPPSPLGPALPPGEIFLNFIVLTRLSAEEPVNDNYALSRPRRITRARRSANFTY